jgi:hypothetical protein
VNYFFVSCQVFFECEAFVTLVALKRPLVLMDCIHVSLEHGSSIECLVANVTLDCGQLLQLMHNSNVMYHCMLMRISLVTFGTLKLPLLLMNCSYVTLKT